MDFISFDNRLSLFDSLLVLYFQIITVISTLSISSSSQKQLRATDLFLTAKAATAFISFLLAFFYFLHYYLHVKGMFIDKNKNRLAQLVVELNFVQNTFQKLIEKLRK